MSCVTNAFPLVNTMVMKFFSIIPMLEDAVTVAMQEHGLLKDFVQGPLKTLAVVVAFIPSKLKISLFHKDMESMTMQIHGILFRPE